MSPAAMPSALFHQQPEYVQPRFLGKRVQRFDGI
jgi:hypothetical protein